uniref:Uncharacterized protein n=1 Tax=Timema poppense TaxID=170557 RepID=A0A7R9H9S1_TIMPO|nr:unnamed protein product [Timema poppensis]
MKLCVRERWSVLAMQEFKSNRAESKCYPICLYLLYRDRKERKHYIDDWALGDEEIEGRRSFHLDEKIETDRFPQCFVKEMQGIENEAILKNLRQEQNETRIIAQTLLSDATTTQLMLEGVEKATEEEAKKKLHSDAVQKTVEKLKNFNLAYLQKHGFNMPLLFRDKAGLGLRVPSSNFSVNDVRMCVGTLLLTGFNLKVINKHQGVPTALADPSYCLWRLMHPLPPAGFKGTLLPRLWRSEPVRHSGGGAEKYTREIVVCIFIQRT